MAILLELVLKGDDSFNETINRFNYVGTSTPDGTDNAAAIVQAFGCLLDGADYPTGLPFMDILALLNVTVSFQFVTARDVYSDTDFVEVPFITANNGRVSSGDPLPPFCTFGFRTNRVRMDIRRGTKRFSGVGENDQSSSGLLNATTQGRMVTVAAAMSAVLTQTLGSSAYTFTPCIAGKQRYDPATGDPSDTGSAYRYYPTYEEQSANLAIAPTWEIYETVRSQVSRQYGRGR
jgi:hypothetical protein